MDIDEMKTELHSLKNERQSLSRKISDLETTIAKCVCEFKIGDRVTSDKNRMIGKAYEITEIRLGYNGSAELFGRRVLKSGALNRNVSRLYDWDGPYRVAD